MTLLPLSFALHVSGFALLAAAMPRHWRQLGLAMRPSPILFRLAGGTGFAAGLAVCCIIWNPARALPIALGIASVAAIAVSLMLSFAPRALLPSTMLLLAMGGALAWL